MTGKPLYVTTETLTKADADTIQAFAQANPLPNLTQQFGDAVISARKHLNALVDNLRSLDQVAAALGEHGMAVTIDLGPIGNAAAAARRDLERDTGKPTFSFPKPR